MTKLTDAELADLVAIHVLGWKKKKVPHTIIEYWEGSPNDIDIKDWNPCNDWNDAKLIIDEMREKGWLVRIHDVIQYDGGYGGYGVAFGYNSDHRKSYYSESFRLGYAVCRAAMKALKAEGVELNER